MGTKLSPRGHTLSSGISSYVQKDWMVTYTVSGIPPCGEGALGKTAQEAEPIPHHPLVQEVAPNPR